jgi:hypothetical protein
MINGDISFVADALFALCDTSQLVPCERRVKTVLMQEVPENLLYQAILLVKGHEPLLEVECREIYTKADLTPLQSKVLEMRLKGWTFEEIGRKRGHTKQGAQNIFVQALKKLARSLRVYPYTGLSEVYQGELRRGLT